MDTRNYAVDVFRLGGAFSVLLLHVDYGNLPKQVVNELMLLGRWAVPFFFMLSGYYFEKAIRKNSDEIFIKTLSTLVTVFLTVNLIYLPLNIKYYYPNLSDTFSITTMLLGTHFHLWFISSLILSYLILLFFITKKLEKYIPLTIVFVLLIILILDPYSKFFHLNIDSRFPRHLISIPALMIGYYYSRHRDKFKNYSKKNYSFLIILGIFFQNIEANLIFKLTGYDIHYQQFMLGTIFFSLGMFLLSLELSIKNNLYAEYGKKYSLLIYLYHPLILYFIYNIIFKLKLEQSFLMWISPILVFLCTLLIMLFLDKKATKLFNIINGNK